METVNIKIAKIHAQARTPLVSPGDLGFDLFVVPDPTFREPTTASHKADYRLDAGHSHVFHTGLKFDMPHDYGFLIKDRSGNAVSKGLHVLAGVIDSTYRGEVMVCILNTSSDYAPQYIQAGDRIAQGVIVPTYNIEFNTTDGDSLSATSRGEKGFGSSGN